MVSIKVLDFKLGEEEHRRRNWEVMFSSQPILEIIDYYKNEVESLVGEWKRTNYDNYFDDLRADVEVVDALYDILWRDYKGDVVILYDYNSERYIIEKQIEL